VKYKYTGKIPAVLLINDALVSVAPGELIEGAGLPSSHFAAVMPTSPKKKVVKKKENKVDATNTDTSSMGK
jgi:hypothetical protein